MREAPRPREETARLHDLRRLTILDSDPEETFDRLARLATRIFDVPIAHVSLIDEHRVWLKARCGIDATEGERCDALCAHTILSDEPLVVEDARQDERFRDSPSVAGEAGIRFYAGAPLVTENGQAVGTLCIKDREPRRFSEAEAAILTELAAIVVHEMEQRLVEVELRKWEHVFSRADWGVAVANEDNPTLDMLNPTFARMHGYDVDELRGKPIDEIFAPEFRDEVQKHAQTVRERGHHVYESLHIKKDGTVFPVQIDAVAVRDGSGKLLYRAAHLQDITERRRIERELRFKNAILETQQETALDGILVVDAEGRLISYNQRFARMWGIPDDILASRSDERALEYALRQVADPERFLARVRELYDSPGESSSDEILLKDGRVFDRYSAPMRGPGDEGYGRVWYFRDVTDRRRAERELRESEERLARILESAMDAIVTIDEERRIALFNAAAEDVFRCTAAEAIGSPFERYASPSFKQLLDRCEKAFSRKGSRKRYMWAPEGLTAIRADGDEFPVEATISQVDVSGRRFFAIILRDVNERLLAERELQSLQQANVYLQEEFKSELGFSEIVGRSRAMKEVLQAAQQVAGTESTVLLTGETGTGKELIARAIHRLSARSERMLVKVNCAALPGGLIESELFGHEKGAFTGALARKIGRFELADRATVFLDEIGDLPPELQVKLLRVLQEGEYERVGGTETLTVDVRVIAATNRDLQHEVEEERFRPDLFYRLNVFPIRMPALRERREDIPLLVKHFVMKHSAKIGKRIETIPEETMRTLERYDWPGNIRELQNVIERAVILTSGTTFDLRGALPTGHAPPARDGIPTLAELERDHVLEVLERTGWRVSGSGGAAEILGLKRTTLEARMKKLGISRKDRFA
jgi:PAS domain S-box-containing protein